MAQRQERASRLVNIIGTNNPAMQIQSIQATTVPQLEDVTDAKFTQVRENVEKAYQTQLEAMETVGKANAEIMAQRGASPRRTELMNVVSTIAEGVNQWQSSQAAQAKEAREYELKLRAQQLDESKFAYDVNKDQVAAGQEQAYTIAHTAIQQKLLEMETLIQQQGEQQGIYTVEQDVNRILAEVQGSLSPEAFRALSSVATDAVNSAKRRQTGRVFEAQDEVRTKQESIRRNTIMVNIAPYLNAVARPETTGEAALAQLQYVEQYVMSQTQDLPLRERLNIIEPLYQQIVDSAATGDKARGIVQQRLMNMQAFYQFVEGTLRPQFGDQPQLFNSYVTYAAQSYGVPELAGTTLTNSEIIGQQNALMETQQKVQEMSRTNANAELVSRYPQYVNMKAYDVAWSFMNGSTAERGRYDYLKGNPNAPGVSEIERAALNAVERWRGAVDNYNDLARQFTDAVSSTQNFIIRRSEATSAPYVDTASGRAYRINVQDQTGNQIYAIGGHEEQVRAAVEKENLLRNQLETLRNQYAQEGIDLTNPSNPDLIRRIRTEIQPYEAQLQTAPSPTVQGLRSLSGLPPIPPTAYPNFNQGSGESYPSNPQVVSLRRTEDGMVLPFAANRTDIELLSPYGMRTSPTSGEYRLHAGIDLASGSMWEDDVGALTIQGGTVVDAFDWNGYGGTVLVRTPDGRVEQYSHLRRFFVQPGQQIPPGTPVGVVGGGEGDHMAGSSTGRHLHFQVWRAGVEDFGNPSNDTIDPEEYLRTVKYNEAPTNQLGFPPIQSSSPLPPGLNSLPITGGFITGSLNAPFYLPNTAPVALPGTPPIPPQPVPLTAVANQSSPIPSQMAPIDKASYPAQNNPSANYGYEIIARDPAFARSLAQLGDELGIPAQWLADIMYAESSLDPHRDNHLDYGLDWDGVEWGHGFLGLIQINGSWLRQRGISYNDVMSMSRAEYVQRIARPYLMDFKGQLHTVEDVLAAIFMGDASGSPESRAGADDGNTDFAEYMHYLGSGVGRRYRHSYLDWYQSSNVTHTDMVAGCPICSAQAERFGGISPHEIG